MRRLLSSLIRLYQMAISPLLPRSCRFYPSCSEYMRTAIMEHGVLRGLALGGWRILRCNPFCHGGFDPVPKALIPSSRTPSPQPESAGR